MSSPHPDRPIAQPKRRLVRSLSNNSVGSTGSQGAPTTSSPLAGFSFGQASGPVSAAKPPVQPNNFSAGFGNQSTPSFGSANTSTGFGTSLNTPPSNPTPTFGFGNANVSSPFGNLSSPAAVLSANTGFSSTPFSGFQAPAHTEQPQQAKIVEIDDEADMDSEDTEKKADNTSSFSGFAAPQEPIKAPAAFSFGTPSTSSAEPKKSVFSGFSFGTPAATKPTEPEKSDKPSFGGFGGQIDNAKTDASTKPAPAFSFGTPASTVNTSTKTVETPSPFTGFGKPSTASSTPLFAGFGTKPTSTEDKSTEPKKTSDTPSLFAGFGTPAKSTGFSFGKPSTGAAPTNTSDNDEAEKSDDTTSSAAPFSIPSPPEKSTNDKPSAFGTPTDKPSPFGNPTDKPSPFGTSSDKPSSVSTSVEKPSPFAVSAAKPSLALKPADESTEKDSTTEDNSDGDSGNNSEELAPQSTTEKPSPFGTFGSVKPTVEKTTDTTLSASAKPFVPSSTAPIFGSFGKSVTESSEESVEKGDVVEKEIEKRASISSVGSNKSSSSAFTFSKPPSSESDKSTTSTFGSFGNTSGSFSFNTPSAATDKPATPSFSFGTPSTSEKPATSSTFSFSTPASGDKPAPSFSFGKPTTDATATSKPFSFSMPSTDKPSPFSFSAGESNKKRQMDRDDDEDGPSASKKTFIPGKPTPSTIGTGKAPTTFSFPAQATPSKPPVFTFGSNTSTTTPTEKDSSSSKPPTFSFGTPASTTPAKSASFSFGAPPKDTAAEKEPTKTPTFSFGAPPTSSASTPAKSFSFGTPAASASGDKETSAASKPFTFGAPAASTSSDKEIGANKTFTFGTPATSSDKETSKPATTTPAPSEKKNFSFGAPPPAINSTPKETTTKPATSSTISFSATTSVPASASTPAKDTDTTTSTEKSSPFAKLPLSTTPAEDTSSTNKDVGKKVSFGLPTSTVPETPGSASLAFSKVGSSESNASSTLNLNVKKDTGSSERSSVPTTLKSNVTEASQISYQTRFWELPDDARNELALLAHFISEQTDKQDKITQELKSSFGPTLQEMNVKASTMDTDATILRQQLEVQSELLDELIINTKDQRLNAVAASNVQSQNTKNWRIRGADENWTFYTKTIESMEHRLKHFKLATDSIEEAIVGLERDAFLTPESIGAALDNQQKMYLALAGRVADLHQEAERVVKRRKLN